MAWPPCLCLHCTWNLSDASCASAWFTPVCGLVPLLHLSQPQLFFKTYFFGKEPPAFRIFSFLQTLQLLA